MRIFKAKPLLAAALLAAPGICRAQNSFSGIDSITSPEMPSVSAPEVTEGVFAPGFEFPAFRAGNQPEKKEAPSAAQQGSRTSAGHTGAEKKKDAALLTASDLSALDSLGLLNRAGILYGNSSEGILSSAREAAETKQVLAEVLSKIEELKAASPAEPAASPAKQNQAAAEQAPARRHAKILRFSVNGYDILKTCRKIYISDVQQDGTFLVTGDRRYASDGKSRSETFHLLFKSSPQESGGNYTAAAAVTQDYLNEYSFLYQLSQLQEISALRTGNFVTVRTEKPDWKLELLIDLGDHEP